MNSKLYDKTYRLPSDVLKHIQTTLLSAPQGEGVKRAKFLLKNGIITYQAMKRIKNFFDTYKGNNPQQYELAGGEFMKTFIERTLNQERDGVERSKNIKRDVTSNVTNPTKLQQTPSLNEYDAVNDAVNDAVTKNALAIIVNKDNQILLLKRVDNPEFWQPGKWSLVGGGVDPGEEPVVACQREIKEETGLIITKFSHKLILQRNPDSIEYVYVCKYDGEDHDIDLDRTENTNYGWYSPNEIHFLNHVPNLLEYINMAFKKYD